MKKLFSLVAACAMTLAASAQIVSSSSRSITTEVGEFANYNRLYISYAPMSFSGDYADEMETASGFALGWLGGWSISKTMPLYLEAGLNVKYNYWSDEWSEKYDDGTEYVKFSKTFLSASIPVSVSYKYSIPGVNGLSIAPYIGLHLTGNIIGKEKDEWGYRDAYDSDYNDSEEYERNLFDKDDMDGSDYTANRIQIGYQLGVGVNYKSLYFGVGYSAEFTEYSKKVNTGGATITLGLNF